MRNLRPRNIIILKSESPQPNEDEITDRKKALDISNKANRINNKSFWVNLCLAIIAFIVFFLTMLQTKSSLDSVRLADSIFKETKDFNTKTIAQQKENSDSASAETKRQFNLQKESITAQIRTLKGSQSRFEVENDPSLEITEFSFVVNDTDTSIIYHLSNFGKHPVSLEKTRYHIYIAKNIDAQTALKDLQDLKWINEYGVVSGQPNKFNFIPIENFPKSLINDVINGKKKIFIVGELV